MNKIIYDMAGIGIGPFNLGLAALCAPLQKLQTLFFDEKENFDWHPGMMLSAATMQVPFYADLVTLVDPSNPFSFLCYLKSKGRLIPFGIRESNYITRREYNLYCKWVIAQLDNLHFGCKVEAVSYNSAMQCYELYTTSITRQALPLIYAKHIVLGIGSTPFIPAALQGNYGQDVFHSGDYLYHKENVLSKKSIAIIGSGQSAAEIFYDLLPHHQQFTGGLHWFTRNARFFPMDFSKLTLEMTSPDYIDHCYRLAPSMKEAVSQQQDMLYKGINHALIEAIYNCLYDLTIDGTLPHICLHTNMELTAIHKTKDNYRLTLYHKELQASFSKTAEAVVLATGYQYGKPSFLQSIKERIGWDEQERFIVHRNYSIDKNGSEIFVQNAELHSHGFNAPDLGMGPYRNSIIINSILGYDHYVVDHTIAFQTFGIENSNSHVAVSQAAKSTKRDNNLSSF